MRVIAGSAKGRKLKTLEGLDVRPTTDKVKEAIFSAIQFDLPGAVVLDLFAGSGQMGIEALSRGAETAVFVDRSARSLQMTKENLESVQLAAQAQLHQAEAQSFLQTTAMQFDIAILDPPYRKGFHEKLLPLLADGSEGLWLWGCGFAEGCAPDEYTHEVLTVRTEKIGEA